uniref:RNase H type-1 domain-containing protein n=1 Tax=Cannabis sativa TaxID=3483 RepID=A0A803PK89_CANSA
MGLGVSSSSLKNDKRRWKGSRSKVAVTEESYSRDIAPVVEDGTQKNLIDSLNLVEVHVESSKNFLMGEEAALIKPPSPMKCLSWNCRGLARDPTPQAIVAWVNKYKLDCVFLMETKVSKSNMEELSRKLGFTRVECVGANGLAGSSCLMWNNSINLVVNFFAEGFFEATVWDFQTQLYLKLYAVYGTPYLGAKEAFWKSMDDELSDCQLPWVLIGDLNCICSQEEKFTWQNNRFLGGLIRERLDRALCSHEWLLDYASARVINLPIAISDHAPIILDTHLFAARGFIPFRFFEAWSWEDLCKKEIANAWSFSGVNATASFIQNIHNSRKALQAWKKNLKGVNEGDIKDLEKRLEWVQNHPITDAFREEDSRIHAQLSVSWSKLESMCRQKSKETWLSLEDRNTRFFHAATVIRKRRNNIWAIKNKDGRVWKDKKHIAEVINSHFLELSTSLRSHIDQELEDLFVKRIDSSSNDNFASIPSYAEIKEVVFCLHLLKAPGPDRFSGCFFRKYWDVVGSNLCATVKEFFSSGSMHPKLNNTFICFIPKVEFPMSVDQFRPISLCNFSYKVIEKILSNRLRPLMNDLVSPFQSAFILGRWIAESSILIQEIIHKIRHKRVRGLMALKLDMHKANDKMEWGYLDRVLCANGLDERCRKLMACVTSEVLSKLICKAEERGFIHGIKIAQSAPPVSHLMFADDAILFACANESKEADRVKDHILGTFNIDQVRGEEKHLGNPFIFKRRKKEDYMRLKDSLMKKLEGWKMKLLSYVERLTLMKTVTSSMPIYAMSTSKISLCLVLSWDIVSLTFGIIIKENTTVNILSALVRIEKSALEYQDLFTPNRGGCVEVKNTLDKLETVVNPGVQDKQVGNIIFTDASWIKGDAGIAAVSVDISIGFWFIKSQKLQAQSALEAEFTAILLALNRAIDLGWRDVPILLDSKIVVQALTAV